MNLAVKSLPINRNVVGQTNAKFFVSPLAAQIFQSNIPFALWNSKPQRFVCCAVFLVVFPVFAKRISRRNKFENGAVFPLLIC